MVKPSAKAAPKRRARLSVTGRLRRFLGRSPVLGSQVYVAPGAVVVGDVTIGDRSSVWYNVVLRGDINRIVVGTGSNIQDNAVVHLSDDAPCLIGDWVTVGHGAIVHACEVQDEVLVGMGAVVLDGAVLGPQTIVGAGAVVPQGSRVPPGSLVLGVPGRVIRVLTQRERLGNKRLAKKYVATAAHYLGAEKG